MRSMDRLAVILHVAFCLTVLVAPTCSSSSWARNILYRPKRQDVCQPNQFMCTSGACIDTNFVCNGTAECRDGSDETENACKQQYITTVSETQEGCLLPQQPEFGSYTSLACENGETTCRQVPGTPVRQYCLLTFKCNDGYYINGTFEDKVLLVCINGKWSEKIPVCRRMCSPLISLSVAVKCQYQGDDIDCNKFMRHGTRAIGICNPSYELIRPPPYQYIFCRENGKWSYDLFYCQPACGKRNIEGTNTLQIINGAPTNHDEFPWHAGLYQKNSTNHWEQICGGSLISPHIIVTAAHCVFQENIKKIISPTDVKVGLGKYYREWTHDEPNAIKSDVREIVIPPSYFGLSAGYTQDIAMLDLTHSVQIDTNIMPVCVDWNHQFTITSGMLGTFVGWGVTEDGSSRDVLSYTELPYIDYRDCISISDIPLASRHHITTDKFCANFSIGRGRGNSGGGLTFLHNDLHYMYGSLSSIVHGNKLIVTFTNVSNTELLTWLNNTKKRFDEVHVEI